MSKLLLACFMFVLGCATLFATTPQVSGVLTEYPNIVTPITIRGQVWAPGTAYGPVGTPVFIIGSSFGTSGTVTFSAGPAGAGSIAGSVNSWSDNSIAVNVPTSAVTGKLTVVANGQTSNSVPFIVTPGAYSSSCELVSQNGVPPTIVSMSPSSGPLGTVVGIRGTGFGAQQGSSTITINGVSATPASWSDTTITASIPSTATSGSVQVHVNSISSNSVNFSVTPHIESISPTSGPVGTQVTITGTSFGATQGTSTLTFNGISATPIAWNSTSITVPVPTSATTGNVVVTVGGVASNGSPFTVLPTPNISNLSPTSGTVGTSVTITGSNFGATQGTSTVIFNGTNATPTAWSATSVTVPVPASATTGNVIVTVNGVSSNGVIFTPSVSLGTPLSIDVTPANTSVSAGTTQQFTATAHYSDGGSQDVTLSASWISSSLSVAVLDVAGTATATAYGQASIQASSGSVTGAALLSVSPGDLNPVITPAYQFVQGTSASYNQKTIDVGNDGFGRFVVGDSSCNGPSDQIVYVRCLDQDCTSSHTTRITTGNWTLDYSMAVGPDGFARIAYSTFSNIPFTDQKYSGFLGFIQCSDDDCSSYSNIPIAGTSDEGVSSIAVRNDGTAFIVFDDGNDFDGPQGVGLATCTNGCSATHIADVNVRATIAGALALDLNGNPTIVYLSDDQFVHYVSSTGVDTIVSSDSSGWGNIEITTAPDGFTRIAFINSTGNAVNYIKCSDLNCGSSVITTIQIPGMSHGVVSMGIGSDGFVRLQVGLSTPYPGSMQFVTCRNSDCSDYNLEKIQGSWDMTKDVISLVAKLNQAPIMLAQSPDGSVKELRAKVPTSAKILENTLTTYSNQTWSSCDGKESKSNQYGYYRCVFYQIQDQSTPPQDVEKILAVNEVVTPVARNVIADIVTAPSATNPAGQFQDGLGFLYSTPLPNGFCTYAKQTLYATDNEKPIRVNCLHYLQSDLDIVDVTSDTSQCAAPTVKCDPLPDAVITGLSPNTGNEGTMVTINGRNFGAAAGQSYVTFNGVAATRPTWTDTQITVAVPSGATTGNVVVKTPFTTGNGMLFTVPPNITGLSPASGAVGTSVLITGKNFGSTASNGSVTFNGATAIPGTWTDTVISVTVPSGATNGNVVVTVNGAPSNGLPFTIVPN